MWNEPTIERLCKTPKLYETEGTDLHQKIIHHHFFLHGSDWYACEFDGNDRFFGFVILNDNHDCAEWGYFSLAELINIKVGPFEVDYDKHWKPCKACEVEKISICHMWG